MSIQYNAFEESANILNLNRIPRFEAGIDMPWTFYQVDIIEHSDSNLSEEERLEGKKRLMYTSESTDGESVSEIKRWVKYGTSDIYTEQNIKNPKVEDYREWGWNLSKDQNGNDILPKFGDFTFKPDAKPDYDTIETFMKKML